MLVQPVEKVLSSSRRLIIVPDRVLAYLPFKPLLRDRASTPNPQSATHTPHYLIEQCTISYVPAALALRAIRQRPMHGDQAAKQLLAFGDPIYARRSRHRTKPATAQDTTTRALAFYTERGFNFTRLPYTRAEVTGIGQLHPAHEQQIYLGHQAQEETLKREKLEQYRYVHFATHGIINEEKPARSGFALSPGDHSSEDGVLQLSEIMRLKLNADVVTLSACSTGLGKLLAGEGIIGLTRAFFYAGARSLVVNFWNVNDAATAELMKAFYQNLNREWPKDEAV